MTLHFLINLVRLLSRLDACFCAGAVAIHSNFLVRHLRFPSKRRTLFIHGGEGTSGTRRLLPLERLNRQVQSLPFLVTDTLQGTNAMPETGLFISARQIIGVAATFLLATFTGWKMFFSSKLQQISDLEKQLKDHISDEDNQLQSIENKIDAVHHRVDDIWKHLAGDRRGSGP